MPRIESLNGFYAPDMRLAYKIAHIFAYGVLILRALIFPLIKYERVCMGSVFSMHGSIHACIDLIARVYS
jgi:hypothetical protein